MIPPLGFISTIYFVYFFLLFNHNTITLYYSKKVNFITDAGTASDSVVDCIWYVSTHLFLLMYKSPFHLGKSYLPSQRDKPCRIIASPLYAMGNRCSLEGRLINEMQRKMAHCICKDFFVFFKLNYYFFHMKSLWVKNKV